IPYLGSNDGQGWAQDIADIVIDPLNNDMYTIFASYVGAPEVNNKFFKNTYPYNSSPTWQAFSGYTSLREGKNRPYLASYAGGTDNSMNMLALNSSYLFY